MRTKIVIDEELMAEAMSLAGLHTQSETVEAALKLLIQVKRQERLRFLRGSLLWEGDLEKMRTDS